MSMDDVTPASRPSSLQYISRWGLVQAWMAKGSRSVLLAIGPRGLRVVVVDELRGERIEDVKEGEDPSIAALRALTELA